LGVTKQQGEPLIRMPFAGDKSAQTLGLEVFEVTPGSVQVQMTGRSPMANGFGICHGGSSLRWRTALSDLPAMRAATRWLSPARALISWRPRKSATT
jgi:acyl-coenzyme A thioesterase PaaI-like protein